MNEEKERAARKRDLGLQRLGIVEFVYLDSKLLLSSRSLEDF